MSWANQRNETIERALRKRNNRKIRGRAGSKPPSSVRNAWRKAGKCFNAPQNIPSHRSLVKVGIFGLSRFE